MDKDVWLGILWGTLVAAICGGLLALGVWHYLPDRSNDPLSKKLRSFLQDGTDMSRTTINDEILIIYRARFQNVVA